MLLLPQSEYDQQFGAYVPVTEDTWVGVAVWVNSTHHYSALIDRTPDGPAVQFRKVVDDLIVETTHCLTADTEGIRLRIDADAAAYTFVAEHDDRKIALGSGMARLLSAENIGWFTNVNFALVAVGGPSNDVTFHDVSRSARTPVAPKPFGIPR